MDIALIEAVEEERSVGGEVAHQHCLSLGSDCQHVRVEAVGFHDFVEADAHFINL